MEHEPMLRILGLDELGQRLHGGKGTDGITTAPATKQPEIPQGPTNGPKGGYGGSQPPGRDRD